MPKKKEGELLGYTVVNLNPALVNYLVVCEPENLVYPSYTEARIVRDELRQEFDNSDIVVVSIRTMKGEI